MSSLKFGQIAPNFNPIKLHAKTSPFQRKAWDTHFEEEEEFKALQRLKVETIESFNMALEMDWSKYLREICLSEVVKYWIIFIVFGSLFSKLLNFRWWYCAIKKRFNLLIKVFFWYKTHQHLVFFPPYGHEILNWYIIPFDLLSCNWQVLL